ncbi:FtsK/SpoIIIE domain-containing protein (plasmid) [Nonomuraea sp. NBC_00507]|uniref:FtsK/SpoIIIE domain-containing protein n=1 Tax=Nonomuraea sp. NBC_00507 TaxID=2976002 RepID=UPI002E16C8DC
MTSPVRHPSKPTPAPPGWQRAIAAVIVFGACTVAGCLLIGQWGTALWLLGGLAVGGLGAAAVASLASAANRLTPVNPWTRLAKILATFWLLALAGLWFFLFYALLPPVILAAVGTEIAVVRAARRTRDRRRILLRLHEKIAPVVKSGEPPGQSVTVTRWQTLVPHQGEIFPGQGVNESAPDVLSALKHVFDRSFDLHVQLHPRPTEDKIEWEVVNRPDEKEPDPLEVAEQRATEVVSKILPGATVKITETTPDAKGFPAEVMEVTFPPNPRTANPENQLRIVEYYATILYGDANAAVGEWDLPADKLTIRRRRELPTKVFPPVHPVSVMQQMFDGELVLPFAVDEDGEVVGWQLSNTARPHALIVGPTGGGKTNAILVLALAACRLGIDVRGVDPKCIELLGLIGWPGVTEIATGTNVPHMVKVVDDVFDLMQARYAEITSLKKRPSDYKRVLLILDEYLDFRDAVNEWWKEQDPKNKGEHPVLNKVKRLAAMARSANIHLLIGTQRPDATLFPEGSRDNFRFRVSLTALSPEGAQMMWQSRHIGTTVPDIQGRAVVMTRKGPRNAQVFYVPNPVEVHWAAVDERTDPDLQILYDLIPEGTVWHGPQPANDRDPDLVWESTPADAASPTEAAEQLMFLVRTALQSGAAHLTGEPGKPPAGDPTLYGWSRERGGALQPDGVWLGRIDDSHGRRRVFLHPKETLEVAASVARGIEQDFNLDRDAIDEALMATGQLETELEKKTQTRRRTVRRPMGSGPRSRARVWDLSSSVLFPSEAHPDQEQDDPPSTEGVEPEQEHSANIDPFDEIVADLDEDGALALLDGGAWVRVAELEVGMRILITDPDEPIKQIVVTVDDWTVHPGNQGRRTIDCRDDRGNPYSPEYRDDDYVQLAS